MFNKHWAQYLINLILRKVEFFSSLLWNLALIIQRMVIFVLALFTSLQIRDALFTSLQIRDALFTSLQIWDALFTSLQIWDALFGVL